MHVSRRVSFIIPMFPLFCPPLSLSSWTLLNHNLVIGQSLLQKHEQYVNESNEIKNGLDQEVY
jgi:hypothetical protein